MTALFHLLKQALDHIRRANRFPMGAREIIKRQAGLPVSPQTFDRGAIAFFILETERPQELLGLGSRVLIENGFQFRCDAVLLMLRNIAQDIFHFVQDTALASDLGEFGVDRI